jgi:hypothetical protein
MTRLARESGPSRRSARETARTPSCGSCRNERPTLPELLDFRVHQRIGAIYSTFAIFLLNDKTGSRVDSIEDECRGKPERIVRKILQGWLEGRGLEPVSWETLVQTLRRSDLSTLADEIQQKLSPHSTAPTAASPPSQPSRMSERPTLPELLRLRLPQSIGANYWTFGILLLNDAFGARVRAFKKECQGDSEDTILRVLQEWLEGRGLDERPTLPELLDFRVHQRIGAIYSTFAIFLLNDKTGSRVDSIEDECRGKPERIVRKILQGWLEGRGLAQDRPQGQEREMQSVDRPPGQRHRRRGHLLLPPWPPLKAVLFPAH